MARDEVARGGKVCVGLAREAGYDVGAEGDARAKPLHGGVAEAVDGCDRVWPAHTLEDAVGAGLDREVDEPADVGTGGEGVQDSGVANPRFERTEPHAHRQVCQRCEEVCKSVSGVAVEREVAAGDDNLAVSGVKESSRAGERLREGEGLRRASKRRDDAEGALAGTAVLHLQVRACRAGGNRLRGGVFRWRCACAGEAACKFDPCGRETGTEVDYGLAAVAFGLCGDGAPPDDDDVRRTGVVEGDYLVALGRIPGLLVERLGSVQPAPECLERYLHVLRASTTWSIARRF